MVNYKKKYSSYWSSQELSGELSSDALGLIVRRILATCSVGKSLDIGCGMGTLVKELLQKGVDAYGLDVAPRAVEAGNKAAPGRFFSGSATELPFTDSYFDTVISTDFFEHLSESDVPKAIFEIYRVTRRHVYITLSTQPDRDKKWHLTTQDRAWWENQFFAAGFRKHPLLLNLFSYESMEKEDGQITLLFEKIPPQAVQDYPLEVLREERDLHNDMQRETGRRSDAGIARYLLASRFVREGDFVLDAACGLGYGVATIGAFDRSSKVLGLDNSQFAIDYAESNFASTNQKLSYRQADVQNLHFLEDCSVDIIVSFETLEHIPEPLKFLSEVNRVLRPGGRFIASVPNLWVDESSNDPNPYHLHVYDWDKIHDEIEKHFLVEAAFAQVAGGGMVLTDHPRSLQQIELGRDISVPAEWWLIVGMKDPVAGVEVPYVETAFPAYPDADNFNVIAFNRDYENPWLVKSMVSIGMRSTNDKVLGHIAERTLRSVQPNSADTGAALCVKGYQLLDKLRDFDSVEVREYLGNIDDYVLQAKNNPTGTRWVISNLYVKALFLLSAGKRECAREVFLQCAAIDPMDYCPLIATKTVSALFQAGVISLYDGDLDGARDCWKRGLQTARQVLSGDWTNIYGNVESPLYFGLPEATQILDIATNCSYGLTWLTKGKEHSFNYGQPFDKNYHAQLEQNKYTFELYESRAKKYPQIDDFRNAGLYQLYSTLSQGFSLKKIIKTSFWIIYILAPPRLKKLFSNIISMIDDKPVIIGSKPYEVRLLSPLNANRPRVVHALANFMIGGSSRLVVDLIEHLGHDYEQEVLTSYNPNPPNYTGLTIHEIPLLKSPSEIVAYLEKFRPTLLHVHYWGDVDKPWYEQVFAAAEEYGCKIVENINTPVEPFSANSIDRYVYVSNYVLHDFGKVDEKSLTIYPGSNFEIFKRDVEHDVPDDCIGMVYRLEQDKLNKQSIDPFIEVVRRRPETRVIIVGGGTFLKLYKKKARVAGVLDSFNFTEYVAYEELPDLYAQMSLFVAPVWKESFGQVSPFAMSMGIPVVGYDIGALSEITADKTLLAPPGDSSCLAGIITDLLDDRQRRLEIGTRNRERAQVKFSVEAMIKGYEALYRELSGGTQ